MVSDALFLLAFYVMPVVAVLAAGVAVVSPRGRRVALVVLAAAAVYLVAYWSLSLPE